MKTETMNLPIIVDSQGEPIGLIFSGASRKRVIYLVKEPSVEELCELLEQK